MVYFPGFAEEKMRFSFKENELHHIPDYALSFDGNNVRFVNRNSMRPLPAPEKTLFPSLDPETYNDATIVAPGHDVYYLEEQWRSFWLESGKPN